MSRLASSYSKRLSEVTDLLERSVMPVFLAGVIVVIACVVLLVVVGTFATLHPGDDIGGFGGRGEPGGGGPGGGGADIIAPLWR